MKTRDRTRFPQPPPETAPDELRHIRRQIRATDAGLRAARAEARANDLAPANLMRFIETVDDELVAGQLDEAGDGDGLALVLRDRRVRAFATVEAHELKLDQLRYRERRVVARAGETAPSGLRLAIERMLAPQQLVAA